MRRRTLWRACARVRCFVRGDSLTDGPRGNQIEGVGGGDCVTVDPKMQPAAAPPRRVADLRVTVGGKCRQYSVRVPLDEDGSGRCIIGAYVRAHRSCVVLLSLSETDDPARAKQLTLPRVPVDVCAGRPLGSEVACSASIDSDGQARFTVPGACVSGAHCAFVLQRLANGEISVSFVDCSTHGSKVNGVAAKEGDSVELHVGAACRLAGVTTVKFDGVSDALDAVDDGDATVSALVGSVIASTAAVAAGAEGGSGMNIGCASGDACTDTARASESDTASASSGVILSGCSATAGDDTAVSIVTAEACSGPFTGAVSAPTGAAGRTSGDGILAVGASTSSIVGTVGAGEPDTASAGSVVLLTGASAPTGGGAATSINGDGEPSSGPQSVRSALSPAAAFTGWSSPFDASSEASTDAVCARTRAAGRTSGDGRLAVGASVSSSAGQASIVAGGAAFSPSLTTAIDVDDVRLQFLRAGFQFVPEIGDGNCLFRCGERATGTEFRQLRLSLSAALSSKIRDAQWFASNYFHVPVLGNVGVLDVEQHQPAALAWAEHIGHSNDECKSELEVQELANVMQRPIKVWIYDDVKRALIQSVTRGDFPEAEPVHVFQHRQQRAGWDIVHGTPVYVFSSTPAGQRWISGVVVGDYSGSNHPTAPDAVFQVHVGNDDVRRVARRRLHCRANVGIDYNEAHFSTLLPFGSVSASQHSRAASVVVSADTAGLLTPTLMAGEHSRAAADSPGAPAASLRVPEQDGPTRVMAIPV
jgi:hypothetical protein